MLQLERVEYHNVGPFSDFVVDLSKYADKLLIAVCGENGVGKSFFLESAFAGAMYRTMPTQGTLVKRATAKDSWMQSTLVNGATRTFRHVLDGVSGKSEAVVLDEHGISVLPDSKVRSFDAWAAKHCPPPEVTFASLFAAQNSSGFLGAKPAERKAILLRVLGIERLELLAARAREHVRDTRVAINTLTSRIDDEKRRATGDPAEIEKELDAARAGVATAEQSLVAARAAVDAARAGAVLIEQRTWEFNAVRDRREELFTRLAAKRSEIADIEERIANNRNILIDAVKIRAAETRLVELRAEAASLETSVRTHEVARLTAVRERDGHERSRVAAEGRAADARARRARAEKRLADRSVIEEAARVLPARREALASATEAVEAARQALEELRGQRLDGAAERIGSLRQGLTNIAGDWEPDTGLDYAKQEALNRLSLDDDAVEEAREFPARLRAAEQAVREADDARAHEEIAVRRFEPLAARVSDLAAAEQDTKDADEAANKAIEEADAARVARGLADATAVDREEQRAAAQARVVVLDQEIAVAVPLAARVTKLAEATARIATHEQRLASVRAELAQIDTDLTATPEPSAPPPIPDVAACASAADAAESEARRAATSVAALEQRLADARASEERLAVLTNERGEHDDELAEWTRLAADIGRDGIQALEIDAAGPELTEMVNDLLHSCFGTRWTISIETTRLSADGKRQLEGCEVMVIDTVSGRTAEAADFSGGEKAILETATSLGLMMLACKRAGSKDCTLVRDESGAAVSKGNVRAYVAMLRRAAERVGARHVLLVSHVPEVVELCDDRINIPRAAA
ncbi:MAG TPA: hypothetical protein VH062_01930 [Polyangiaceae bacterium]|nr:hypothetical protein [Polyangiaceae bacterium]